MNRFFRPLLIAGLLLPLGAASVFGAEVLPALRVERPPVIDGSDQDDVWQQTKLVTLADRTTGAFILLKSVYTDDSVFFLVQYPDAAHNPLHKPWVWNKEKESYEEGPHREDTFVFKWNMTDREVDLSNFSDDSYTADIWYWKANRTNPAGHADDKMQILGDQPGKKTRETISPSGKKRYLERRGDRGREPFTEHAPTGYEGEVVDRYPPRQPEGSRADVRAKGVWRDGFWVIEFGRKLDTGQGDDIRFDPASGKRYLFGVSIFSLYGNPVDKSQPNLYGQGRISDPVYLEFRRKTAGEGS